MADFASLKSWQFQQRNLRYDRSSCTRSIDGWSSRNYNFPSDSPFRRGLLWSFFIKPKLEVTLAQPEELPKNMAKFAVARNGRRQCLILTARKKPIIHLIADLRIYGNFVGKFQWSRIDQKIDPPQMIWKPNNEVEDITGTIRIDTKPLFTDLVTNETTSLVIWNAWEIEKGKTDLVLNTDQQKFLRLEDWKNKGKFELELNFFASNDIRGQKKFRYYLEFTDLDKLQLVEVKK